MDDKSIIKLYLARDESAIEKTAEKYGNYLFKISYNILYSNEDCEECVNDTYLGAWKAIPPHEPDILLSFLGKMTRRIAIDLYRKKNRKKRSSELELSISELAECIPDSRTVEKTVENKEISIAISHFLSQLKPMKRQIFICRYWYSYSIKDVAKIFYISESKAKSVLFRVRMELKQYLEKEGIYI